MSFFFFFSYSLVAKILFNRGRLKENLIKLCNDELLIEYVYLELFGEVYFRE